MLGSALIVFRETLEAALLIGIIAAVTRGLPGRERWLALGIGAGLAGALAVAGLTERSPSWRKAPARSCSMPPCWAWRW